MRRENETERFFLKEKKEEEDLERKYLNRWR